MESRATIHSSVQPAVGRLGARASIRPLAEGLVGRGRALLLASEIIIGT